MRIVLEILLIFALLWSCKRGEEASQSQQPKTPIFQLQNRVPKFPLNPKATALVETWEAFVALEKSVDVLYKARSTEDAILAIDDLIEKESLLAQSSYPERFNTLPIKSRQRVVRTYLYKVKFSLLENQPATAAAVEMLQAYNALRRQFNSIVNNVLDSTLLEV